MIPVTIKEIAFDISLSPVVLLVDQEQSRVLPIWIGPFEAQSIAMALQGLLSPRPMTHDLINSVCEHLGAIIRRVVISDIKEGTYFAEMHLQTQTGEVVIDSRPSDALALALRSGAGVFITEKVADYTLAIEELVSEEDQEELRKALGLISPDDLKKSLH